MRYPLVDGQGNFGSVDGDPPAAMRYTESRMTALATEMLADIDKDTVDFAPNFDDRLQEPRVLPAQGRLLLSREEAAAARQRLQPVLRPEERVVVAEPGALIRKSGWSSPSRARSAATYAA